MKTNFHISQGSSISKSSTFEDKTKLFLKGNLHKYREKRTSKFLSSTLYLFHCNLNSNSGLRHSIKSFLIALWNFLSFPVSQFVTSLEPPALTFYNLALFSIYGNDGTTISRRGVIINLKKYHWEKVQKGIPLLETKN